jgi:hypothetical protein
MLLIPIKHHCLGLGRLLRNTNLQLPPTNIVVRCCLCNRLQRLITGRVINLDRAAHTVSRLIPNQILLHEKETRQTYFFT